MKRIKQAVRTKVVASLDGAMKYALLGCLLFFYLTSASLKYLVQ